MFGSDAGDGVLLKLVNQKLSRSSGSQSRISATVQRGTVTITGNLQYDAQKAPLLKSVACIAGVRRVIDQLRVTPRVNQYAQAEARAVANANAAIAEKRNAEAVAAEKAAAESATEAAVAEVVTAAGAAVEEPTVLDVPDKEVPTT